MVKCYSEKMGIIHFFGIRRYNISRHYMMKIIIQSLQLLVLQKPIMNNTKRRFAQSESPLFISFTLCLFLIVNGTMERVANMVGVSICLMSWTTDSIPN